MDSSKVGTTTGRTVRRLLIVADNSLIVEAIRIGFRRSSEFNLIGHVRACRTSTRMILEAQPDVVLVDDLDGRDGALALVSEISQQTERVNVIVLSIGMDAEHLTRLLDAGATTVISKACHPRALATLVSETLNGHIVHRLGRPGSRKERSSSAAPADELSLTGREQEILRLAAGGCTNGEIARRLWVTEQTVKFHLRNVYRKLGVANRTQASHFAHVNGLVEVESAVCAAHSAEISAVAS